MRAGVRSLAEVFREAKALIATPETWVKGELRSRRDGRDCFCSLGALGMAEGGSPSGATDVVGFPFEYASGLDSISAFNDAPTTTHADVMAAFDRAIAYAERHPKLTVRAIP